MRKMPVFIEGESVKISEDHWDSRIRLQVGVVERVMTRPDRRCKVGFRVTSYEVRINSRLMYMWPDQLTRHSVEMPTLFFD